MSLYQRGKSWYYDFWRKGKRYVACLGPVNKVTKHMYAKAKIDAAEGKLTIRAEKPPDPLFREVAADFLEDYQATRRLNSAKSAKSHIALYLKAFGSKRMSDITVKDIQAWQTAAVKQGKKPATVIWLS